MMIDEAQNRILEAAVRTKAEGESAEVVLKATQSGLEWTVDFKSLDRPWSVGGSGAQSLEEAVQDAIAGLHRPADGVV